MPRPLIPNDSVPIANPDGTMQREWFRFFTELARASPGWSAASGIADRATFDTETVGVTALARRVKAIIDDDLARGAKGA
jgi:hypothetical protein